MKLNPEISVMFQIVSRDLVKSGHKPKLGIYVLNMLNFRG